MIEVIYKDEKQTAKGNEGILNLPKNIRQIGMPGEEYRIYIEDYVYTFVKKMAERAGEEKGLAAVFTGEIKWDSGTGYLFIKGAILADTGDITEEHVELNDSTWQKIHEVMEQYFLNQEIVGWFLTRKSLPMEVSEGLQRIHMKLFGAEKVLMLMDPTEKEEAFFRYENGLMINENGYYIYYEKNPSMQTYMMEKNPEFRQSDQESVSDDAVRTFRKIIQKKQKEDAQEPEEKTSVFSYAATACLVLAVMTVGVQFYQSNNHKNQTETIAETTSRTVSLAETTKIPEITENVKITPTSALKKNPTPLPESPVPTETLEENNVTEEPESETNSESIAENSTGNEREQEIYREEADTRKAERRVREEKTDLSEEKTTGAEETSASGTGASYVIKPGDTLYQISISRYGTMDKVSEICKMNGLTEDEIIYPGQIIVLP